MESVHKVLKGEDKMKEKQGYKIVDIKWDTDGDKALFDYLPQEIILPEQFCTEDKDDYDYLDEVSEWLSDEYGYCQSGFRIQKTVSLKEWLMMQFNYCNLLYLDDSFLSRLLLCCSFLFSYTYNSSLSEIYCIPNMCDLSIKSF